MYGAEIALLEMVSVLKDHHTCVVFTAREGLLSAELRKMGVVVEISKYRVWVHPQKNSPLSIIKNIVLNTLYSINTAFKIKKYAPDIIFSNTIVVSTGIISAFLINRPHIMFAHEFLREDPDAIFDFGERITMKIVNMLSDSVVVVSKTLFQKYQKLVDSSKLKLIYLQNIRKPSVNEKSLWPIATGNNYLKLIMVGSTQENKNQMLAIEAVNELKKTEQIKLQLLIVGAGNDAYSKALREKVLQYQLQDQVYFMGYIDNPYPYIMGADCVLMLSNFESFSRVIIEAMSCEKTVIAPSNSGGPNELITNGSTGLIYKKDSASDLASKISYVYNNRKLTEEMGANAKEFSNNFHKPDKYYKELDELLKSVVRSKQNL